MHVAPSERRPDGEPHRPTCTYAGGERAVQARREFAQAAQENEGKASEARQTRQRALEALGRLDVVAEALERDAAAYSGFERKLRTEDQLSRAEQWARDTKPSAEEIRRTIAESRAEDRVIGIAQMLGHPEGADIDILLGVLRIPRSGAELEQALRTTQKILKVLSEADRERLDAALRKLQAKAIELGDAYTPLLKRPQLRDLEKLKSEA